MKLIIDTREQLPLDFTSYQYIEIERKSLPYGDYAAEIKDGYRLPIYFERKEKDLFSTLTGEALVRFKKEIARAKEDGSRLILIMCTEYNKLLEGDPNQLPLVCKKALRYGTDEAKKKVKDKMRSNAESKEGTLISLAYDDKYMLPHIFVKDRELMARYIYRTFYIIGCRYLRKKHNVDCLTKKRLNEWL